MFSKNFNDFSVNILPSAKKNFDIRTLANMGPCANSDLGYVQSITDSFQWRHEKLPGGRWTPSLTDTSFLDPEDKM